MTLWLYRQTAFNAGTKVGRIDKYVSNGTQTEYVTTQKPSISMLPIVQAGNSKYRQSAGSLIKTPTGFTLSSAPADGTIIIAPANNRLIFPVYNKAVIGGQEDQNSCVVPFWFVDAETISDYQYEAASDEDSILLSFIDHDENFGVLAEWFQFGYADPETGDPPGDDDWLDAGEPFEIQNIDWNSELSNDYDALDSSIIVENVDDLISDETTIFLKVGQDAAIDHVQVESVNYSTGEISLVTPLSYAHEEGEKIYLMGVKGYARLTVPVDTPAPNNYFDVGVKAKLDEVSRLG